MDIPKTTGRHVEPLSAFAKGAFFLRQQIEAAEDGEAGARAWIRETMPRNVMVAWRNTRCWLSDLAVIVPDDVFAESDTNADVVISWFLRP